jgi:hypothetical protein
MIEGVARGPSAQGPGRPAPERQRQAEERLLAALRQQPAERPTAQTTETTPKNALCLVKSDAAVLTGLPADEAEAALRTLARDYRSHLMVTEEGELVYQFAPGLPRRGEAPLSERLLTALRPVGSALVRGLTVAFKIWIAATLVLYTTLFVVLGIALMLANNGDDDGPGGILLWWLLPDWMPSRGRRRQPAFDDAPRKPFHRSVFDFVFGPKQDPPLRGLPAGDDRPLLSYIRQKQGRIGASDLVLLTGWSYRRAEEEATRLLVQYDGEPEVADNGSLVYTFRDLRRTADNLDPGDLYPSGDTGLVGPLGLFALAPLSPPKGTPPAPYIWDQTEFAPLLTGNRGGTNLAIALLNAFNLVGALTIGSAFASRGLLGPTAALLITLLPFLFSVVFFSVPLGRYLAERVSRPRRTRRNLRRALLQTIAARGGAAIDPGEAVRLSVRRLLRSEGFLPGSAGTEARTRALLPLAHEELSRLHRDLDGDIALPGDAEGPAPEPAGAASPQGAIGHYVFPRFQEERQAVEQSRKQAEAREQHIGEVIFSSASEGAGV